MASRALTLEQAARHLHIPPRELLHLAQRCEAPARKLNDEYFFELSSLDEWAQRHILCLPPKELLQRERTQLAERRLPGPEDAMLPSLLKPEFINPALDAKTKPGAIRAIVGLAFSTGLLYDDALFLQEVSEREEAASTAIPGGVALLHAKTQDPWRAEEPFAVFARTLRPLHFGAPDGEDTDLFFLLCCLDAHTHLRLLSRLCRICRDTELLQKLRLCEDAEEIHSLLVNAEVAALASL